MRAAEWTKNYLAAGLLARQLTVSGEIIIEKIGMEAIGQADLKETQIFELLSGLTKCYPCLKLKVIDGLCDVTVKIFSYNKTLYDNCFYENLQNFLERFIEAVIGVQGCKIRLNIYGEMASLDMVEKFRYLNKGERVSHKIEESNKRHIMLPKLRRKLFEKFIGIK
jgi:hypothetical protein